MNKAEYKAMYSKCRRLRRLYNLFLDTAEERELWYGNSHGPSVLNPNTVTEGKVECLGLLSYFVDYLQ